MTTYVWACGSGEYTACALLYRSPGQVLYKGPFVQHVTHGHQTILVYVTYSTDIPRHDGFDIDKIGRPPI